MDDRLGEQMTATADAEPIRLCRSAEQFSRSSRMERSESSGEHFRDAFAEFGGGQQDELVFQGQVEIGI